MLFPRQVRRGIPEEQKHHSREGQVLLCWTSHTALPTTFSLEKYI